MVWGKRVVVGPIPSSGFEHTMTDKTKKNPYWYLHIGRATDLEGFDRRLYRLFEILPGALSIATLGTFVALAFLQPTWAAYLTIIFSIYWLFKTVYLSLHLRHNFRRVRHHMALDWQERLKPLKYKSVHHLVIFPFYKEGYDVVAESMRALVRAQWDLKTVIVVLAVEERAGAEQREIAERIGRDFGEHFLACIVTVHPIGQEGDIPGKGSNISYAAREAKERVIDALQIPHDQVLVSAFDVDSVVYPQYFSCLTWNFLTAEDPYRSSFQPVPLYNNNIWNASTFSRVIAYSSSFWQMIQQERPEKLSTFSSHAIPLPQLIEVGYWQRNVVSEDSRIFWNLFVRYDGDYRVVPLAYPISMDANMAPTFFSTIKQIYKQHRRWTYGVENIPYMLFAFTKNPRIPFRKKARAAFVQIEGFWSLTTHPLILFAVGWLPLIVGGHGFTATVLSYNLPFVARSVLTLAMLGLVASAAIAMALLPPRPAEYGRFRSLILVLQWLLVPITMVVFSSIPGLDAQLRLMSGRYLGFWVTPKMRSGSAT